MEAKFADLAKAEGRLMRIEAELQTAEVRLLFLNYNVRERTLFSPSSDSLPKKSSDMKKNILSLGILIISMRSAMSSRRSCESIRSSSTTSE